jgi:hypothetical protein
MPITSRFRRLAVIAIAVLPFAAVAGPAPANAAAAPSRSQWPQYGQTERHLGTNPDEQTFNPGNVAGLRTQFTAHFGDSSAGQGGPVVANGIMYIADFDGNLSAFASKGCGTSSCEPLWRGQADNSFDNTPAVAGGLVLIGAGRFLYAFPAAGCGSAVCQPQWKGQLLDGAGGSSVAVSGNTAYIGDFSGHLYAFALQGCGAALCKPLWVGQGASNENLGAPAVGNGFVYVSSFQSLPDLVTGRLLVFPAAGCGTAVCSPTWAADLGGPAGRDSAPTVTADTVFVGSSTLFGDGTNTDFHLFAFPAAGCGAKACKPLRSYDTGDGGVTGPLAVAGNLLYASTLDVTDNGGDVVVSAYPAGGCGRSQCAPQWSGVNLAAGFMSGPSVVGGVVFVGKGPASGFPVDSALYGFNAAGCGASDCAPISFVQLGEEMNFGGSPLAVAEGKVFMASTDNTNGHSNVYAVGLPS